MFVLVLVQTITPTPISTSEYGVIEFLRDPLWQFVGAILGLAAVIVTITLTLKDRGRKRLSSVILAHDPLISIAEEQELKDKLTVSFDDRPLAGDVYSLIVQFINTGNVKISDRDFVGPIRIECNEGSEVLTAGILQTGPRPFDATAEASGTRALLHPVLLNKNDFVVVKMLVRNLRALRAAGHIEDGEIEEFVYITEWVEKRDKGKSMLVEFYWTCVFTLAGFGAVTILIETFTNGLDWLLSVLFGFAVGILLVRAISMVWSYIRRSLQNERT